uniref:Uncharacterized protein LOC111137568 isoform X2 n=1 Tax=Crassostrea virginica TaxID=6565 RepID=A0A8B8EXR6_CRAVI|nr:uncharacterized protein LOC111137568 isoform X2 [Crassostrea virginica]
MAITFHTCCSLYLVLFTLLEFGACDNRFKNVKFCPANAQEWENRAKNKSCQEPTPDFMCAAIENHPGKFGEICTIVGLSSTGQCAVLDADTYNLNYIDCSAWPGCPSGPYRASDVYKYPVCYNITFSLSTSPPSITDTVTQNTTSASTETVVIFILTFILFSTVLLVCLGFMWRKRSQRTKQAGSPEQSEVGLLEEKKNEKDINNVSMLGTYLKYRLIAISDLSDLRNKMLLHSKSLNHHHSAIYDKIKHMSKEDDLKMLDLNIVYMLLTNFCDIPSPSCGWGNKPNVEDLSLSANIERIRILVNDYLDHGHCDQENADEIIKGWIAEYGEINRSDIIDLSRESKINYLKIKPDCFKKNGVVVTRAIDNVFEKMKSSNIVICLGAIGCGKTTALEFITKEYKDQGWQIEWVEEFIDDSCIDRVTTLNSERTILCCDNYCGSFGCHMFSQANLARNESTIMTLFSCGKVIKVLIGIHKHVYDEIESSIGHRCFQQHTNSFVDLDSLSESELLWIYKTQEEKGTKKQEPKSYEDLLTMTNRRSGLVGIPFQTMMMYALPDICFSKAFCNDPFQMIIEHFKKLTQKDKGQCAALNAYSYNLDFINCSSLPGCPSKHYLANDVYKYQVCYNTTFSEKSILSSTNPPSLAVTGIQNTTSESNEAVIIVILTFVLYLLCLIIWSLFMWRKNICAIMKQSDILIKPDCIEKNGVVVTRAIDNILEKMK